MFLRVSIKVKEITEFSFLVVHLINGNNTCCKNKVLSDEGEVIRGFSSPRIRDWGLEECGWKVGRLEGWGICSPRVREGY